MIFLGFLGGPNVIPDVLVSETGGGGGRRGESETFSVTKLNLPLMALKTGEGDRVSRNSAASRGWKGRETHSPPEAPERTSSEDTLTSAK